MSFCQECTAQREREKSSLQPRWHVPSRMEVKDFCISLARLLTCCDAGGKSVFQTAKKRAKGPKCSITGKRIAGVRLDSFTPYSSIGNALQLSGMF